MPTTEQAENAGPEQGTTPPGVSMEAACNNSEPTPQPSITPSTHPQPELPAADTDPLLRRSSRQRRPPEWITTYAPS